MPGPDAQLIDTVESGQIALVNKALDGGASPNARKRVTVSWTHNKDGLSLTKRDTIQCESALALAVVSGRADIVEVLLRRGSDPDVKVEWKIPLWYNKTTFTNWDKYRWIFPFEYPCCLALALAQGGNIPHFGDSPTDVYSSNGPNRNWKQEMETGLIRMSRTGGDLTIADPSKDEDAFRLVNLQPNLDVLIALLRGGAKATDAALAAARKVPDPQFLTLLEAQRAPEPSIHHLSTTSATNPQNVALINAVELNRADLVRKLVLEGDADPSSRKRMSFLHNSSQPYRQLDCESALVLAIVKNKAEVVKALLANGLSDSGPVEWHVCCSARDSTLPAYGATYSYPSILALAVGRGGTVRAWDGSIAPALQTDTDVGKVHTNKVGAEVRVDRWQPQGELSDIVQIVPSLEVVSMLLHAGASVTADAEAATSKNPDVRFIQLLTKHKEIVKRQNEAQFQALLERHVSELTTGASTNTVQTSGLEHTTLADKVAALEFKIAQLTTTHQTELDALKLRVSTLERDLKAVSTSAPTEARVAVPPRPVQKIMHVIRDFMPTAPDEVLLQFGQQAFVNVAFADGWASGMNTSTHSSGFFPLVCVSETQGHPSSSDGLLPGITPRMSSTSTTRQLPTNPFYPSAPPPSSVYWGN
ncbi:hypothetical protein M427DRAFT_35452 [Gonapodya prolifera JEL478]|uniref:Uncharacterized protein n=1 Tax=Gonapodya prolifera (strain JEL478) TaxID=1344416 RepID=A0A139A4H8_GONPJ|nr:hypothetical protein M427DRAFT_35452 [Gonapodya prolifera JEL478]|eukprot:KXS11701.1 hypothetical protein M427DRAFT_35452 [Gonapodya prolifera JEL478]